MNILTIDFTRSGKRMKGQLPDIYQYLPQAVMDGKCYMLGEWILLSDDQRSSLIHELVKAIENGSVNHLRDSSKKLTNIFMKELNNRIKVNFQQVPINSVIITANEYNIPWQILLDENDEFLAYSLPFSFIPKTGINPKTIEFTSPRNAVLICNPDYDQHLRKTLENETDLIKRILEKNDIKVDIFPNESSPHFKRRDMEQVLKEGKYDIIHFTGHGFFENDEVGLFLYDGTCFYGHELKQLDFQKTPSIVFLNCCFSGRNEDDFFTENSVRGMNSFGLSAYSIGVKVFIGAMTSIYNDTSRDFAEAFYNHFVDYKKNLGESMLLSRKQIYNKYSTGHKSKDWAKYICFGHPNFLLFETGKKEFKRHFIKRRNFMIAEYQEVMEKGITWILNNAEYWSRDIHQTAEMLNLLKNLDSSIIEEIPKIHIESFKIRINNLFEKWINNEIFDEDVGVCRRCNCRVMCNQFPYNYVNGYISEDLDEKIIKSLLGRRREDKLWNFGDSEGFKEISPHSTSLVLQLFLKKRGIFENVFDANLSDFAIQSFKGLISIQKIGWNPPKIKPLLNIANERYHKEDKMINTLMVVKTMNDFLHIMKGENKEALLTSLKKAKIFFINDRMFPEAGYWWNSISHVEDRAISLESDIRGTSFAIIGLLSCGENPLSEIVEKAVKWLINSQREDGSWPLDSRKAPENSSVNSTRHAIEALNIWLNSLSLRIAFN